MKKTLRKFTILIGIALLTAIAAPVNAVDQNEELRQRVATLEAELQRMKAMEREVAELKAILMERAAESKESTQAVTKLHDEIAQTQKDVAEVQGQQDEWKSYDSTVHLSGYGSVLYSDDDVNGSAFSRALFAPIFHYQWRDLVMLESELEIQVGKDGSSELDLEYATIDLFLHDNLALVAGKFLSPVGQFRQNLHPSWINKLASAPVGFGHDQAAPVADLGVQARGGFALPFGNDWFANYAVFIGNGPILELNEDGDEIEAIEAAGAAADADGNKVYGGRVGLVPLPNTEVGFSIATGDAAVPGERSRNYDVYGADWVTSWRDLTLRGEWLRSEIDGLEANSTPAPEGHVWETWYTQLSYRVNPTNLETVIRYGDYNSDHRDQAQSQWAFGANWWFNSHTVAKFTYELNKGASGEAVDADRLLLEIGYGF